MIENIGIDIIENNRIEESISDDFVKMILTSNELKIFNQKKGIKKIHYICGIYTAKESIIKAINHIENPHFKEIEILNKKNGAPYAIFKNYKILISISHEQNYTISQAILLK